MSVTDPPLATVSAVRRFVLESESKRKWPTHARNEVNDPKAEAALPYSNRIVTFHSGMTSVGCDCFAQYPDEHCHRLLKRYANANRARLNGSERFIKLAAQSVVARAAVAQSQAAYAGA